MKAVVAMTMQCPKCGSENNYVINVDTHRGSEPTETVVRRKRGCADCGCRWYTVEEYNRCVKMKRRNNTGRLEVQQS